MISKAALMIVILLLASCDATYKDVSIDSAYASMQGKRFATNEALLIHGITTKAEYAPPPSYYLLTNRPGIGGPEVISQDVLPKGTVLSVTHISECTNCLQKKVRATVLVADKPTTQPIMIDIDLLQRVGLEEPAGK